jgi:hypothetical protein
MAAGEDVSVVSRSDTEQADLLRERAELKADPVADKTIIYFPEQLTWPRASAALAPIRHDLGDKVWLWLE